jgi:Stage II sporulation protein E (SpoIIE)
VIDSTVAGRSYQHVEVLSQRDAHGGLRVWLPLLDGAERLGVIGVTVADPAAVDRDGGLLRTRLLRFAALAAELVMTKTLYGDTLVRLRRRQQVGLAAEMQWALLPPLTFASRQVTIAAALEPAYEVAGDSVDYAVDAGRACLAIFDGMGHGLRSALLAVLAVAAYRNARRAGLPLTDTAEAIDSAVATTFRGEAFVTAALAELDTDTGLLSWVNAGHQRARLEAMRFLPSKYVYTGKDTEVVGTPDPRIVRPASDVFEEVSIRSSSSRGCEPAGYVGPLGSRRACPASSHHRGRQQQHHVGRSVGDRGRSALEPNPSRCLAGTHARVESHQPTVGSR